MYAQQQPLLPLSVCFPIRKQKAPTWNVSKSLSETFFVLLALLDLLAAFDAVHHSIRITPRSSSLFRITRHSSIHSKTAQPAPFGVPQFHKDRSWDLSSSFALPLHLSLSLKHSLSFSNLYACDSSGSLYHIDILHDVLVFYCCH